MTSAPKELTPQERNAAIAILTTWNGSRACMAWAVDGFPKMARAMLAEARKQIALLDGEDHADPTASLRQERDALAAENARLREALEPFARADRAIGRERGPFRFQTSTGYRLIEREDLAKARAALGQTR